MAVGQTSLYIWKAIVTQAITFYYLYHQNNGRFNNILAHNTEIMMVFHNNRVFKHYRWIIMLEKTSGLLENHPYTYEMLLYHHLSPFNTSIIEIMDVFTMFLYKMQRSVVVHNNTVSKQYCWIQIMKQHNDCWTIILIHMKSYFNRSYHFLLPLSSK